MSGRVRYTAEFKQEAVVLSRRVGVVKAARDLGVSALSIISQNWLQPFARDFCCDRFAKHRE